MAIRQVTLFSSGMLMVFGEDGEQLPEYQGPAVEHLARVLADARPSAEFRIGDWRNGVVETSRECLAAFAEQWERPGAQP